MCAISASFRRGTKHHIERCIECYIERCFKHCPYVVHFALVGVSSVASSTAFDAVSGAVSGAASGVVSGAFAAISALFRCCFRASCQRVIVRDAASVPFAELQSSLLWFGIVVGGGSCIPPSAVSTPGVTCSKGAACGANSSAVSRAVS